MNSSRFLIDREMWLLEVKEVQKIFWIIFITRSINRFQYKVHYFNGCEYSPSKWKKKSIILLSSEKILNFYALPDSEFYFELSTWKILHVYIWINLWHVVPHCYFNALISYFYILPRFLFIDYMIIISEIFSIFSLFIVYCISMVRL